MTHPSEPRLSTARSRGRPAVLAPHQPVDLLQPALLPPDGCQIAVCWACATHGLLQPSRRHGRIALLTTLALADSPSLGSASCSCFGPSAPSVDRHTLSLPILADERTRVEAVKWHGDFTVLSSHHRMLLLQRLQQRLEQRDSPRSRRRRAATRPGGGDKAESSREKRLDRLLSHAFSSDHCGRNRAHNTSSVDPPMT